MSEKVVVPGQITQLTVATEEEASRSKRDELFKALRGTSDDSIRRVARLTKKYRDAERAASVARALWEARASEPRTHWLPRMDAWRTADQLVLALRVELDAALKAAGIPTDPIKAEDVAELTMSNVDEEMTGLPCHDCGRKQQRLAIEWVGDELRVRMSFAVQRAVANRELKGLIQLLKGFITTEAKRP